MRAFGSRKGQSLVELGTLGALLIFCLGILLRYGMSTNHQEDVAMRGFRKAFVRARSYDITNEHSRYLFSLLDPEWKYENRSQDEDESLINPPLPSNNWREVSYTVVEDRLMPSGAGILPIAEHTSFSSVNSALWSIDVSDVTLLGDDGKYRYNKLPRAEYEINGKKYSFTTSGFKEVTLDETTGPIIIKKDIKNWDGQGVCWQEKEVGRLQAGDTVDLDEDSYEETVLESDTSILQVIDESGNLAEIANSKKHTIRLDCVYTVGGETVSKKVLYTLSDKEMDAALKDFTDILVEVEKRSGSSSGVYISKKIKITKWENALKVLDQQEGEIDLSNTENIFARGGLQNDSSRRQTTHLGSQPSKFVRSEGAEGVITTDEINAKETITRIIKTKAGYGYWDRNGFYQSPSEGRLEVKDEFTTNKTETWDSAY